MMTRRRMDRGTMRVVEGEEEKDGEQ